MYPITSAARYFDIIGILSRISSTFCCKSCTDYDILLSFMVMYSQVCDFCCDCNELCDSSGVLL